MYSWYNDSFQFCSDLNEYKKVVDWIDDNRFGSDITQFINLFNVKKVLSFCEFPEIVKYAYSKNLKFGIAYSEIAEMDMLFNYNLNKSNECKLWYAVSEIEPYSTNRIHDYNYMTRIISETNLRLKEAGLRHIIYMGHPIDSYWETIVQHCDEINLNCYLPSMRMNSTDIWKYVSQRLVLISQAIAFTHKNRMKVNILYSCEKEYAFDWFKIHYWSEAHKLFLSEYEKLASPTMRAYLSVGDFCIYNTLNGMQI